MFRLFALLVALLTPLVLLYCYKKESMRIGFCLAGRSTNLFLEEHRRPMHVAGQDSPILAATAEYDRSRYEESRSSKETTRWTAMLAQLFSFSPEDCTPCPAHSICTPATMTCDRGLVIAPPSALSLLPQTSSSGSPNLFTTKDGLRSLGPAIRIAYTVISTLFNGLPGFGPVSFPPSCVKDLERARRERAVRAIVADILQNVRGELTCQGQGDAEDGDAPNPSEAQRWGLELQTLKSKVAMQIAVSTCPSPAVLI